MKKCKTGGVSNPNPPAKARPTTKANHPAKSAKPTYKKGGAKKK